MSLARGLNDMIKEMKKTHASTYFALLILLIVNLYGIYSSALGKLISLVAVIYIVLNENVKLGLLSFFIILLLNNKNSKEGFENEGKSDKEHAKDNSSTSKEQKKEDDMNKDKDSKSNVSETSHTSETSEINDPIASFKKLHCKNSKIMKDGVEISIADMTNAFPQLKFNLENEKCNPCEDNCHFKITSGAERITVEEKLRPTSSTAISSE